MIINLVRLCKNVIFKYLLKGDGSVIILKIKVLCIVAFNVKY